MSSTHPLVQEQPPVGNLRAATILTVDDNAAQRALVAHALREAGFAVLEADSGQQALPLLDHSPDLVVLGSNLSGSIGLEVCRQLRLHPTTAATPILHVSAASLETADIAPGLSAGTDAFLVEPLHPSELIAVVNALLRLRRSEEEARRRVAETEEARARLNAILATMGEGLCQLDAQGRIAYLNPAGERILGHRAADVHGCGFHELVHAGAGVHLHVGPEHCPLLHLSTGSGGRQLLQDYFRRQDGSLLAVEYTCDPVVLDGTATGTVVSFRDISEQRSIEGQCFLSLLKEQQARRELEARTEEIRGLNAGLEERVRRRTAELEDANRELEAFTYSVSHDLRAPLRSIGGFAQILLEKQHQLDAQGRDSLRRLCAATHRMGELMDSLLQLARVTRAEMQHEQVDLSALARGIAAELRRSSPARKARVRIARKLVAYGDPLLLRVALENLLDNAWKFTARRSPALIEFGLVRNGGMPAYFVCDNGIGFDMAEGNQLFLPFRRLHAASEFEGHGIGLVTVERILRRHGGRVWAEGHPGKGATFYFSLP